MGDLSADAMLGLLADDALVADEELVWKVCTSLAPVSKKEGFIFFSLPQN